MINSTIKTRTKFVLKNGLKAKRYAVRAANMDFASILHFARHFGFDPNPIYRAVKAFLDKGTKFNGKPRVTRTFVINGLKAKITILNAEYESER